MGNATSSYVLNLLAQDAAPPQAAPAAGAGMSNFLLMMVVIFFIFYFLIIRPEGRKRKERQRKIAAVKKGDVVMTTGGVIGKIWKVEEHEVVIQIDKDKDVKARFAKSAIFELLKTEGDSGSSVPSEDAVRQLEQRAR